MPVTIRDVAKAAGVSAMSVSKVLHGRGDNVRVSEETAAHIRRTAEQLNYRPNALARSFRQGRTRTLGMVWDTAPDLSGDIRYFSDMLDSAVKAAFAKDYSVTLCPTLVGDAANEAQADGRFDGVLWCRVFSEGDPRVAANVPTVMLHLPPEGTEHLANYVCWDNENAVRQVVGHLADLGHRNVAYASTRTLEDTTEATFRRNAFMTEAERAGMEPEFMVWEKEGEEFADWWSAGPKTTALVCWSEQMALGVLHRAWSLGVSIPGDLSVVGFDSTSQCETSVPRLTAPHQPLREMTARAVEMLIERIESGPKPPENALFPSRLDVRDSTAAPRGAAASEPFSLLGEKDRDEGPRG